MSSPTGFSKGIKWNIFLHVILSVLAFAAIVLMVNYLSARHFERWDLSRAGESELTPRTKAVIGGLTNTVDVTVLFDREAVLYGHVTRLLEEYKAASPHIRVRQVDYLRDPSAALEIKSRYQLPELGDLNAVIFDYNKNYNVVTERQLADLDFDQEFEDGQLIMNKRFRSFRGELEFTSALFRLISARPLKAYFLQNHGEHNPADNQSQIGYAKFTDVLRENNIQSAVLKMGSASSIPTDCDLLVIPGPTKPLLESELKAIESYLNQGGRMMVLFNFSGVLTETGLEALLGRWGVSIHPNVVMDEYQNTQGGVFVTSRFGRHPVVNALRDTALVLTKPRTVYKLSGRNASTLSPSVEQLFYSSTNSVVLTEIRDGAATRTQNDYRGEASLAVAVEKGNLPGVTTERSGVTRMVVTGDSYFLDNQLIELQGNREFASMAVNWLLDQDALLSGIGPRPIQDYEISFNTAQLQATRWVLIAGMPGAALLTGLLVWLRRRS